MPNNNKRLKNIYQLKKKLLRYAAEQGIKSGAIFITRSGKSMSRTNIWREMKNLCEQANVNPDKVIVPVGWNFKMDSILNSQNIPGSANNDVNPLRNEKIKVIADAELNALAGTGACPWFMAANTLTARGIQVDYLNGQKTPTIRRAEVPGTLGLVWDIYMDWGISVRDFRGFVKNPGATLGK